MAVHLLAHGLGGRTDLPMDGLTAIAGGGVAIAASFLALTVAWRRPRLFPDDGRPLPRRLARALDARALTVAGRTVAFAATALVVVVALTGPPTDRRNLAPWALFVTFWVGLVPVSVLCGPVWRRVNPVRGLYAVLVRAWPYGSRRYPSHLGYWPAAGWLACFVWLELVAPNRSDPRLVGALILGYALVNVFLALVYGTAWFERGDGFEVYSTLMARMCVVGRRADGALVLRTPLTGLMRGVPEPGLVAVACVLVGSTGFDGVTRTTYWRDNVDPGSLVAGTAGLAAAIGGVTLLYLAATRATATLTGEPAGVPPVRFAATLLPIALGYTVAHYFSFFLLEGQMTVILASDPYGTGLNLLGSAGHRVDYAAVPPWVTALVQVNAIVLGHVAATIAAHDLALRDRTAGHAARGQLPIAAAMVALTCAGLFALLSG
ncbi:hypothetical protein [Actinomadura sp. DC4]|uniref:hypothetical protein n=1 Tax=Actinomadura sp. DC4 TaxID=3055069 RepID=UPI0025B23928|nr:hypothetical protein [Actinomadura sp. DC4]MDN3359096.1 hypothetical protein [Actinomadura sp. DC4]